MCAINTRPPSTFQTPEPTADWKEIFRLAAMEVAAREFRAAIKNTRVRAIGKSITGSRPRFSLPCDCGARPRVLETRKPPTGVIRRRVECPKCAHRWTTYDVTPGPTSPSASRATRGQPHDSRSIFLFGAPPFLATTGSRATRSFIPSAAAQRNPRHAGGMTDRQR